VVAAAIDYHGFRRRGWPGRGRAATGDGTMFNPTQLVIDSFIDLLRDSYVRIYTTLEPSYPGIIDFVGRMALENIANSDAPYHDVNHTIMVTLVGQEILKGKHMLEGGVSPHDWLHFVISLLCHDIGYVRGICKGDGDGEYVADASGRRVALPAGATDASLTPHHIDRAKLFVLERFGTNKTLDTATIASNIEHTRFPFPEKDDYTRTDDFPGLLRSADLIGQMADINYMRKISALFFEFKETGESDRLGYANAAELRSGYPRFFWKMVSPFIDDALRYLRVTQDGKQWIANLYAQVFAEEHQAPGLGPERG
jgi:hypothetical protein